MRREGKGMRGKNMKNERTGKKLEVRKENKIGGNESKKIK
jgi:hypothetical protein